MKSSSRRLHHNIYTCMLEVISSVCVSVADAPEDQSRKVDDDTVIISNVPSGSSAVYQCNASNEFGYLMANAFVSVLGELLSHTVSCRDAEDIKSALIRGFLSFLFLTLFNSWSCVLWKCRNWPLKSLFLFPTAEPPRVLTPPNRVYQVISNNPALLDCASFGSPIPVITW